MKRKVYTISHIYALAEKLALEGSPLKDIFLVDTLLEKELDKMVKELELDKEHPFEKDLYNEKN